ncbi:PREDICTED: AAA-ATPase At5g17730-like isoform X1 [Camelina sativa]|uniref:AAA-ATPase At5g17730-like isoform X1 n=2 Tax=Camelina sativa TaxID=90675 RepID=A0ABM0VC43_CAMSA|nr:PREDICTED: AAA-ATPase At5g17730-like isoform X1 [Camelina sativa]
MFSLRNLPSLAPIVSAYALLTGYIMMIKPFLDTTIPPPLQNYIIAYINSFFISTPSTLTLIIDDQIKNGMYNELYGAAQVYLSTKINTNAERLRISRDRSEKNVNLNLSVGEVVSDVYQGIELKWRFCVNSKKSNMVHDLGEQFKLDPERESFELSFEKKHRDLVLNSYVPYVERKAKVINNERKIIKMYSYCNMYSKWQSVNLKHPSTFHTMAMKEELKRSVMGDLDRFIRRKDFYKRVGKPWKRGYLLYGPPGTGKTSLVAAMANYLKFDIYDLQLARVREDAHLKRLLLGTTNSSILLIEDIDRAVDLHTRLQPKTHEDSKGSATLTLSGILNCIDGLWSSCGDERIVIFTTNHKERLDQALLRAGRMDMHIYMGHCCFDVFKTLASNYLGLSPDYPHHLYPEIKRLIDGEVLTPAQVAEELMKNEDADVALEGLVKVLRRKRSELEKYDGEI